MLEVSAPGTPELRRVPLLIPDDPINNPFRFYHRENRGTAAVSRRHSSNKGFWEGHAKGQWDSISGQGPSGICEKLSSENRQSQLWKKTQCGCLGCDLYTAGRAALLVSSI